MKFIWAFQIHGEMYLVLGTSQENCIEQLNNAVPRGMTIAILEYVPLADARAWVRDTLGI